MANPEHPAKGKYYLVDGALVEVMQVKYKPVIEKKVLPKERWFDKVRYEDVETDEQALYEVWWWVVGDDKLPGKRHITSKEAAIHWNWKRLNYEAEVLIHQARIIHNLETKGK